MAIHRQKLALGMDVFQLTWKSKPHLKLLECVCLFSSEKILAQSEGETEVKGEAPVTHHGVLLTISSVPEP